MVMFTWPEMLVLEGEEVEGRPEAKGYGAEIT